MVCLACLLPLFLIPVVNALPLLIDFILAKVYLLFGWEYRKPERSPPVCPYKPAAGKIREVNGEAQTTNKKSLEPETAATDTSSKLVGVGNDNKSD
ncbi:hypothetical protein Nepgr_011691 [Nepenthes gracilis]|uniref:Transmembrane protein n=1 Tax=Nepenthes gracilis TaxID=150966 RepID=A0AAD3SFL2_NEPGR|nr:hypothetical protein Nepgr_011691 [Nepenthes gracilis]